MFHMKHRLKTFVKLAVGASVAMCLVNKFIESTAVYRHLLKKKEGTFYKWRHGAIYYTKSGSGSPLLVIHDLHPAASRQEWAEVISSLSKDHTVYAIDLLGCGRSEKPNIVYSNYLYMQLISDFAEEIIRGKTDVLASGKSCAFAITAAKMHPDLFGSLRLVNPESLGAAAVQPNRRSKMAKAILSLPILGVSLYYILTSFEQLQYEFTESYFYNPFHIQPKLVQTYYESAHLSGGRGRYLYASIKGHYVNLDVRYALSSLSQPIDLIFGEEIKDCRKIAQSYQNVNASVCCHFVEKTKALPQLEAPEKFCRFL